MNQPTTGKLAAWIRTAVATIAIIIIVFFAAGYFLSLVGWYGGRKWRDRVGTDSIDEAKARGVFVKELKYKFIGFSDSTADFHAYIEHGFRFGTHSSGVTLPVTDSRFPYQLNFSTHPIEDVTARVRPEDLKKFDSVGEDLGYLKSPELKDTIELDLHGEEEDGGKILVWQ